MALILNKTGWEQPHFSNVSRDFFSWYVGLSILVHSLLLVVLLVKSFFLNESPLVYENVIRVDLIALPDKNPPVSTSPVPSQPEQEDESSEPTTPAVEAEPPKKEVIREVVKKTEPSTVGLKKKETLALKKLKQLTAFEKIKQQLDAEARVKTTREMFKGNQLSKGSELSGIDRLNHENYIADVKKRIYEYWDLPEWLADKRFRAQVLARFDEDGNLISKRIVKSSGNPTYDEIVMEAVQKASPVPKPPEKISGVISQEGILIGFPE